MKTFEERYTAWVDGELNADELQRFEAELAAHPDATTDRDGAHKLGNLLREFGGAPALGNAEFFNHQLLASIEADQVPARRADGKGFSWSFGRWGWIGAAACAAVMAVALSQSLFPPKSPPYMAQIIEAEATEDNLWVTAVHSDAAEVTVLWVDGLEYLPASYQLQ